MLFRSTRAKVDVSLLQVPEYQVNTGQDQASQATAGNLALTPPAKAANGAPAQANQGVTGKGGTSAAAPGAKPAAGPNSASPKPPPAALPTQELRYNKPPGTP